jgi:catechol 2,3-dioxygenase-like lactoylglutathione lyase family enzyme
MPKIRHIALATNDPVKTAAFYKEAFGFKEVGRTGSPDNPKAIAWGFYLSDGTINLAILKFQNVDQLGKGLDYVGVHHFGILVDDIEAYEKKLAEMGAPCFMKADPHTANSYYETKFKGPDGTVFDLADHPWVGAAPAGVAEVTLPERKTKVPEPAK